MRKDKSYAEGSKSSSVGHPSTSLDKIDTLRKGPSSSIFNLIISLSFT